MSPIYVRPEREQAEHDRLIRFLQAKYSRKFEALANPGDERVAPVKLASVTHFPDLVLNNEDKRLAGLVEIETAASVNNLETMAKWVPFSRARVPFHLYVPVQGYETTLRLVEAHQVKPAEIWTYRSASDGFDLIRMFADPALQEQKPAKSSAAPRGKAAPGRPAAAAKAARPAPKPAAKPAKPSAKAAKSVKPARAAAKAKPRAAAKPVRAAAKPPARRVQKPVKKSASSKPAAKGGKKGTSGRKGR